MMNSKRFGRLMIFAAAIVAGGALAAWPATRSAGAAPLQQGATVEIEARGLVDLFGGFDPACVGCNGEYDPEDETAANDPATALPEMTFVVKDITGTEVANGTTTPSQGIQSITMQVPELAPGGQYILELSVDPAGWQLCSLDSRSVTISDTDFQLASVTEDFHFFLGCGIETPTPTATSEISNTTPTPGTPEPPKEKKEKKGGSAENKLGSIKGIAFIDLNGNGILDPEDPGLNDVRVMLHGGGLELAAMTPGTGTFSFEALGAGEYDVFISPGPEWTVTTPRSYKVRVSGNIVTGIDFGLTRGPVMAPKPSMVTKIIRLPHTGIADLSQGGLVGVVGLGLALLCALGLAAERKSGRLG